MNLRDEIRKILNQEEARYGRWDSDFHLSLPCMTKKEIMLQLKRFPLFERLFAKYVIKYHKWPVASEFKSWIDDRGIEISGYTTLKDFEQQLSVFPSSLLTELCKRYVDSAPCKEYIERAMHIDYVRGYL
jgi:hypothetical protein